MSATVSKEVFIEKLRFYLSFRVGDDESEGIISDYGGWFADETQQGKSEEEICLALGEPRGIVKKIASESGHPWILQVFRNSMILSLCIMAICLVASLVVVGYCSKFGYNCFYFLAAINFLYFLMGVFAVRKPSVLRRNKYTENWIMLIVAAAIILSEIFILPRLTFNHSGIACVAVAGTIAAVIVCAEVYFALKKFASDRRHGFVTMLHMSGVVTILLFVINRSHMLGDGTAYLRLIVGSICLYAETVLLCAIFYMAKAGKKGVA